jgi:hypothetical protein
MKITIFLKTLFVFVLLQIFALNQGTFSQTNKMIVSQVPEAKKSISQGAESDSTELRDTEKRKAPDNKTPAQFSSSKEIISDIYPKKVKEMVAQILSPIPKGKVVAFVDFYLKNAKKLSKDVGYVPLLDSIYTTQIAKFKTFTQQK